jgi:3-deoxy-D-manno-octulosonate 8-phosphate phosphatase (KDO 8-P phosphatase)
MARPPIDAVRDAAIDTALAHRAAAIRLLALDVDGTLTGGGIYIGSRGEELKAFDVQDGLGIKLLQRHGIEVALITGRGSPLVELRAKELGITHVVQRCGDKRAALERLCGELDIALSATAFMGDDLPDLPALAAAGFAAGPANAHPWILPQLHWQSAARGGAGAVRELCDLLLVAQGHRQAILAGYLPA